MFPHLAPPLSSRLCRLNCFRYWAGFVCLILANLMIDQLPCGVQCSRDSSSSRIGPVNSLAVNSRFTPHRQRPTPLRSTVPFGPSTKPATKLRHPRPGFQRRRLLNRTPCPHSVRTNSPLPLNRDQTHQLSFLSPHRFHRHRIRTERLYVYQRSGLRRGFLECQYAVRRRV
jgi:hypothetical protein